MHGSWYYFIGILLFSLLTNAQNSRTSDGLDLSADTISRDYEARTLVLEGNVKIGFGADRLSCQKAIINMRTQEVIATGQVILESADTYIEGEKIRYNYKTKIGEIEKGLVQSGQVVFMGDIIKKNSDTNFVAQSAKFTSCATCPAAWSFSGKEIDAEIGGYAYIKYPVLRIVDFPIFILPRLMIPLKSDRQSGVLVPSLDYSSIGGAAFTLPYFWAISPSQDATYSLKSYEKRGLKHLLEYRYVLSETSHGYFSSGYLQDQSFTSNGLPSGIQTPLNRGFFTYNHYYDLPDGFVHRANLNLTSDLRYPRDFSEEVLGHGDPALENKFSITKNFKTQHFSAEAAYYTNLLQADTRADNNNAVHRLPEISYSFIEREILNTNINFRFDFNYSHFARRSFSYDDVAPSAGSTGTPTPVRDGQFDYSPTQRDLIRTGHRYIIQPTISYPFHIGRVLDVTPSVTYNETQYRFNADAESTVTDYLRNAERRYLQTDLSLKTKYSAVYGSDEPGRKKYKHEIEPEIIYSQIPFADRPDHIFFGNFEDQPYSRKFEAISNDDFFGDSRLQFDYRDRLFDKDIATLVLSNYIIRKDVIADAATYQKFFTFRVAQSYDLNEAKRVDPKPWSTINGLLDMRLPYFETHTTADYYPYAEVTNFTTRLKFISQMQSYLELTYSENVIVKENLTDNSQRTEAFGTGLGFKTKLLDLVGRTHFSLVTDRLESWEYVALLKLPGDCFSVEFGHKKTLGSDTKFKLNLNFEFGGI